MKKQPDKGKITALYERLSHDDERAGESVSIENQKRILEDYAQKNGFTNIRHFTDDGVRGTTFKRPGLDAMLEEIRAGNVATVIIKDQSRIGRDVVEVGLLKRTFDEYHVRFIAANDNLDTANGFDIMSIFRDVIKNISHSGKVSNDFSLFRRFCCINRCFRCSCGKFSIVHGVQAAIGFQAVAIGEKGDLPETHPVQPRTESKRPCRLTRAKPASKGSDRALSV